MLTPEETALVLLAAGRSRRFDGDKLAVEFRRSMSVLNPAMKDNRPVLAGTLETT